MAIGGEKCAAAVASRAAPHAAQYTYIYKNHFHFHGAPRVITFD